MSQQSGTQAAVVHGVAGTQARPAERRRWVNVTLWVLQGLLAISYAFPGILKVTGEKQTVAGFDRIGLGDWFRYLIGTLEIAGAIGLLIPILCGLASLAFVGLMIGATITQIVVFDGDMVANPVIVGVVVAVVAWGRRDRTVALFRLLAGRGRARA